MARDYEPRKYEEQRADSEASAEKARFLQERRVSDLKKILSSEEGRRWIYGLLEKCYVFRSVMTGNSYTFFNEGMRQVGLMIMDEISHVGPDTYSNMHQESFKWLDLDFKKREM